MQGPYIYIIHINKLQLCIGAINPYYMLVTNSGRDLYFAAQGHIFLEKNFLAKLKKKIKE